MALNRARCARASWGFVETPSETRDFAQIRSSLVPISTKLTRLASFSTLFIIIVLLRLGHAGAQAKDPHCLMLIGREFGTRSFGRGPEFSRAARVQQLNPSPPLHYLDYMTLASKDIINPQSTRTNEHADRTVCSTDHVFNSSRLYNWHACWFQYFVGL